MTWFKENITIGNWIVILVMVFGFVTSYAERNMAFSTLETNDSAQDVKIELNSDYRKQGHSLSEEKSDKLDVAHAHSVNNDIHMPYSEKVKVFVPRTEFDITVRQLEKVSIKQDKIYDMVVDIHAKLK